jgi:hypothetical protein
LQNEKVLDISFTIIRMYLILLNWTHENGKMVNF